MKIVLLPGAVTASMLMVSANAAPLEDPWPTLEVRYIDLDLTKAGDQAQLKHRLARAATVLCKEVDNATPVAPVDPTCYRVTLQRAVQQMDRAITRAKGGPVFAAAPAHR